MAKYEHVRTYVVKSINKGVAVFTAPKGRKFSSICVDVKGLSSKQAKKVKVGAKVPFVRVSNQYTTYFVPKA